MSQATSIASGKCELTSQPVWGQVNLKNLHNHAGVFMVQDLDEPTAKRIQELSGLLGAEPSSRVQAWVSLQWIDNICCTVAAVE